MNNFKFILQVLNEYIIIYRQQFENEGRENAEDLLFWSALHIYMLETGGIPNTQNGVVNDLARHLRFC